MAQTVSAPGADVYHRGSDLLALGFGTTVTMWAIGYVSRFPGVEAPAWLLMVLLLVCLVAGGWLAGRHTSRGVRGGLQVGLLVGVLNLLVLGSLLTSTEAPNQFVPSAVWWLPGSLLLAGVLGAVGAALARPGAVRTPGDAPLLTRHGLPAFAIVAAAATWLLLVAGGIVTGHEAGLAVTDWPNSYGYNMFLYPLSRMTGGIYYEHVHRLLGSLVGLTTLVLAAHLWRVEPRRWLRVLALVALVLVIGQGILGGLRVTGHFTLSDDPTVVRPNLALAIVHGVTGQLFFGLMIAIAAVASRRWFEAPAPQARPGGGLDRKLATTLLAMLVIQLVLGALLRHAHVMLHAHITVAALVLGVGLLLGARLVLRHGDLPTLRRTGQTLMHGLALQFVIGFVALYARGLTEAAGQPHALDVVVTTIHQALGALLIATAVLAVLWTRRLLQPADASVTANAPVNA
jgi:cytochrome c oxidase assembly protein subunit 15